MSANDQQGIPEPVADWHVYLIRTRSGALYTGIATDVARRLSEHERGGKSGAKYLRAKAPLKLVYQARLASRALALKAELRIKKLPKREKEAIVTRAPGGDELLAQLGMWAET